MTIGNLLFAFASLLVFTCFVLLMRKPRRQKGREPWEKICDSLINHPEQWKFKDRTKDDSGARLSQDYKLHYQCYHEKSNVGFGVGAGLRWGDDDDPEICFYDDVKTRLLLTPFEKRQIHDAFKEAIAAKLRLSMNPEQVIFKDNEFFCPHCGEKVAADIVVRNDEPSRTNIKTFASHE